MAVYVLYPFPRKPQPQVLYSRTGFASISLQEAYLTLTPLAEPVHHGQQSSYNRTTNTTTISGKRDTIPTHL